LDHGWAMFGTYLDHVRIMFVLCFCHGRTMFLPGRLTYMHWYIASNS
jgi:hypothetical protein